MEARIFPQITGQKEIIDYYQYNKILQNFILSKEQGGLGLKTEFKIQVNVTSEKNPNIRETIVGKDAIKLYWLSNDIKLVQQHSPDSIYQMIKTRKDFINLKHYPVRIAINEENITGKKDFKLLNDTKFSKEYRFQNRVSVFTEDNLFRIDFTSVKFESGKTFKQSKVVNSFPIYEIEIEFIGSNDSVSKEDIFESFIKHTALLLSIYYNTTILLSNSLKNEVLDKYKLLISTDKKLRKSNRKNNKNKYNFNDYIELQLEFFVLLLGKSKIIPDLMWLRNKQIPTMNIQAPRKTRNVSKKGVEKEDVLYEVDKIVDESKDRYKIRWVGYKPSDDTWQLKSEIRKTAPIIVKKWEASVETQRTKK